MKNPFYFYHLLPKSSMETNREYPGIVSLWWLYNNDRPAFQKHAEKYKIRLCTGWGIYPNRDPKDLDDEEILTGINKFRGSVYGANQIYLFRFPPYRKLGTNMKLVLDHKDIYRIDLFSPKSRQWIRKVDFGHDMSFTGNQKLTLKYYLDVSKKEYFSRYRDEKKELLFASLNHISVVPKHGYLPWNLWERVETK